MSMFVSPLDFSERYLHPSTKGLLQSQIRFSSVWFLPLFLVVAISVSAIIRYSRRKANEQFNSINNEERVAEKVTQTPFHIGVIMDGNRRYGREKHGVPTKGHWDGGHTLIEFLKWCLEANISVLTVYAFSSENWSRPQHEINVLMQLFLRYCARIEEESKKNGIRVNFLSTSKQRFPADILSRFQEVEKATSHCNRLTLNVCVSYGAREELTFACQNIARHVRDGVLKIEDITSSKIRCVIIIMVLFAL